MTDVPRFRLADWLLLLGIVAAAGGLRAWYLTSALDSAGAPAPLAVQDRADSIAPAGSEPNALTALVENLKDHQWCGTFAPLSDVEEKTAHLAPGYAWLVSRLHRLLGDGEQTTQVMRWTQVALGALTAGLFCLFARRAFRSGFVGMLAGLLYAINPFAIISTLELADGVLASFLLALALAVGARASQEGEALGSLVYGLTLAALTLVRAALLPFAVVAWLWFLVRCREVARGWLCALLAVLGFANGLAPWTVRNFQTFGELVPVSDSVYLHLWVGNNPLSTGGPQDETTLRRTLPPGRLRELLTEQNQAKRYNMLGREVLAEAKDDPAGTLQRRLKSGLCFVFGEAWLRGGALCREERPAAQPSELVGQLPLFLDGTLLAMLALGLLGWRWSYGWRRESMPLSLAFLWIPLPYLLTHAAQFCGPRLPLDGVLLCYSAFALACMIPGVGYTLLRGSEADPPGASR
jgi:hypothetical protein